MSKPLWPAVSGAIARDHQVEVISNNLANAGTNGFKRDDVSFKEYLVKTENPDNGVSDIPRSPLRDKDIHPLDGRDQSFVIVDGTHTKFSSGGLKVTDNPLDLALNGPGFFEVSTPNGIRYTKAGSFKMAPDGKLVTTEGYPVLSAGSAGVPSAPSLDKLASDGLKRDARDPASVGGLGATNGAAPSSAPAAPATASDAAARYINFTGHDGSVHINDQGEVYVGEDLVAQLGVVEFTDTKPLRKVGGLLFENKNPDLPPVAATQTAVKQGMVETSNVNPVQEISNLIRANRMFEEDLKAMKTVNEMLSKEVNDVPKF
jgi:flagellar basal-body rod protein FlgF